MTDLTHLSRGEWFGREHELEELFKTSYPILVSHVRSMMPDGDYEEVAMQAFSRLAGAAAKGQAPASMSSSYLRTLAKWVTADHLRALRNQQVQLTRALEVNSPDEEASNVTYLIRSPGASELLYGAMDRARRSGDRTTFRVSALLLDIAEKESAVPSDRRVAKELGISHVSVSKARARLRSFLDLELDAQSRDMAKLDDDEKT